MWLAAVVIVSVIMIVLTILWDAADEQKAKEEAELLAQQEREYRKRQAESVVRAMKRTGLIDDDFEIPE
jgi:ABC-type protease/lipase transport system fused ATPase/permease subunit